MTDRQIHQLIADAKSGNHSRRALLQRAAAMGLSFPAAVALFTGARPLSAFAQDATPAAGATNPDSACIRLVFPAPLRPITATNSPTRRSNDTSLTAQ